MISRSLECPERTAERANDTSNRYRTRHMGPQDAAVSCLVSVHDRVLGTHTAIDGMAMWRAARGGCSTPNAIVVT